jgi:hypothetical protein
VFKLIKSSGANFLTFQNGLQSQFSLCHKLVKESFRLNAVLKADFDKMSLPYPSFYVTKGITIRNMHGGHWDFVIVPSTNYLDTIEVKFEGDCNQIGIVRWIEIMISNIQRLLEKRSSEKFKFREHPSSPTRLHSWLSDGRLGWSRCWFATFFFLFFFAAQKCQSGPLFSQPLSQRAAHKFTTFLFILLIVNSLCQREREKKSRQKCSA